MVSKRKTSAASLWIVTFHRNSQDRNAAGGKVVQDSPGVLSLVMLHRSFL